MELRRPFTYTPAWCEIETKGEKENEPYKHETFRNDGTNRPYKLGQGKRRICSRITTSSPHTERRDPDKWAGIESGRNESGRSRSVFAGSAPWLSWSVYRNEIRERKTTKVQEEFMALLREQGYKTAVAYGAEQAREVIRHYLARGEGFDLVNCEHAFKMCGYCEGVAAIWAPCEKCQFFKANKERGKK